METKQISPIQYAKWYGCTPTYIHRLLLAERLDLLPKVISVTKYSRFYTLEVSKDLTKDGFRKIAIAQEPLVK